MKKTQLTIYRIAVLTLAISMSVLSAGAGTVDFADLAGQANNSALPNPYSTGLPTGVTATWNGWLAHETLNHITPMSIFPSADLGGNDAEIIFSEPVIIPSFSVLDKNDSNTCTIMGYRFGSLVWQYDGLSDDAWHTAANGADIEIDTLVAEGKWNHLDNIVVELPDGVTPPDPEKGDTVLKLANVSTILSKVRLDWVGAIGVKDQLESTTSLGTSTVWQAEGSLLTGLDETNSIILDMGADTTKFFRVSSEVIPLDELNSEVDIARNGLPTPPAGFVWEPNPDYTDEFNGSSLDTSKWQPRHPYWSGRAPSQHLPANVSVADGKLRLKNSVIRDPSSVSNPSRDVWVGAACVTSVDQTAFYGYYEAKVKASSVCMTSAFWFQSKGSPATEIDVVEQMGVSYINPGQEYEMRMNSHYVLNGDWNGPGHTKTPKHWTMPTRSREEYHVYGVWWVNQSTLHMYHNGVHVASMTPGGPFNVGQYMFFDTEVFTWEGLPTVANLNNDSRNTMYVDWVRGWRLVPE